MPSNAFRHVKNIRPSASAVSFTGNVNVAGSTTSTGDIAAPNKGEVIQVVQGQFKGTHQFSGFSWHSTSISASITPRYSNSKILVIVHAVISVNGTTTVGGRLYRNGALVTGALGNASGNRTRTWFKTFSSSTSWNNTATAQYLDSPASTAAQTYNLRVCPHDNRTTRINYNWSDANDQWMDRARAMSTITLMEIRG